MATKPELMAIAATLTQCSCGLGVSALPPIDGKNVLNVEDQIKTQHERWYMFLQQSALPDETIYKSPPASSTPAIGATGTLDPTVLANLAKQLQPLLAAIPGAGGAIASAAASAVGNIVGTTATTPVPAVSK